MVMSFLGSVVGGLMSANAQKKAARDQFQYQSMLQSQAAQLNYDYGQKSLLNSPSSQRQGLESAGYNPMLAVQNATSGANAGWTTTGQAQSNDYAGAISAGVANAQSLQRLKNETEATESMNDKNYAEADEAKVRKASLLEKLPFISKRERAEISNIDKDSVLKESQIHNIDETTRFIEKRYELDKMLGMLDIDTQRRGQDKAYNASTYATNVKAQTERGTISSRYPLGIGQTRYYKPDEFDFITNYKKNKKNFK